MKKAKIKVPASTANLGPGFDCLGLALDLWNQAEFTLTGKEINISIQGEGDGELPTNQDNLIFKAFKYTFNHLDHALPEGIKIICKNQIPLNSGLGSSASATLLGILGAKALLDIALTDEEIIQLGTDIEGHPDNITPSLLGGLTISLKTEKEILTEKIQIYPWNILVVLPEIDLRTQTARNVLPSKVQLNHAVQNIGNSLLLVQALQNGDILRLRDTMVDNIHQDFRFPLMPGAKSAIEKARQFGAAAAISGAGPSIVMFTKHRSEEIQEEVVKAFYEAGSASRVFNLEIEKNGAKVKK